MLNAVEEHDNKITDHQSPVVTYYRSQVNTERNVQQNDRRSRGTRLTSQKASADPIRMQTMRKFSNER